MIKMHQMPPGAVEEKADQLLEHLVHGLTLAAFAQPREARGDLLQPSPMSDRATRLNPPRLLKVSSVGWTASMVVLLLTLAVVSWLIFTPTRWVCSVIW
jgi:hypothetical protein